MQIILLEKVANLGNLGDVVRVKDGFARNFLIPQRKARQLVHRSRSPETSLWAARTSRIFSMTARTYG